MHQSQRSRSVVRVVLATVLVSLSAVAPVVGAELPPRTGDQINLLVPPATVPANVPFWIGHGWCTEESDEDPILLALNPRSRVDFTIDGVAVVTGTDVEFDGTTALGAPCIVLKISYYNARIGLPAGQHTIAGCWYLEGELQFCREAEITFE